MGAYPTLDLDSQSNWTQDLQIITPDQVAALLSPSLASQTHSLHMCNLQYMHFPKAELRGS